MFEYKFLSAPRQVDRNGRLVHGSDGLAGSLEGEASLLSAAGWEFVRCDRVPVTARRFLFFTTTRQEPVVVYRRPIREPAPVRAEPPAAAPPDRQIRPRRVSRNGPRTLGRPLFLTNPAG